MKTPEGRAKWEARMQEIGSDGLTGYQRRGNKIKQTRLKNGSYVDQGKKISATLGKDGLKKRGQAIAKSVDVDKRGQKISETLRARRTTTPDERQRLKWYRNEILFKSRQVKQLITLPNFEHWGAGGYELDHKFSIKAGFVNNVSVDVMCDIFNLQFLPKVDNIKKGAKCSITLEQLMENLSR